MARVYKLISPSQNISERTYKSVRSLKSWAKHYLETCAVPDDLVLIRRTSGSYGFMRFSSPSFSVALKDKVDGFWFAYELKYE